MSSFKAFKAIREIFEGFPEIIKGFRELMVELSKTKGFSLYAYLNPKLKTNIIKALMPI